jgi:hydroxymethylbilane synthase
MATLRLGTRRSPLALHQANLVRDAIAAADPAVDVELVAVDSEGDTDPRELREIGERGIFASSLERDLRAGRIDAAVHSSKDLVLEPQEDLVLAAWLPRADPRDALVAAGCDLIALPAGATLATGSARRASALRRLRGDLRAEPIRGNVATRIERARERGYAGLVLAMAGLERLAMTDDLDVRALPVGEFVPEAGQGAVVVQARAHTCERSGVEWARIDDLATRRTAQLERELARLLGGGCERPVGVHAELGAGRVHASWAPDPDAAATVTTLEVVGLELATLVGADDALDIDEAAAWTARRLAPQLAEALGAPAVEAAR